MNRIPLFLISLLSVFAISSRVGAQPMPPPPGDSSFIEITANAEMEVANKVATVRLAVNARGKEVVQVEKSIAEMSKAVGDAVNSSGGKNTKSESVHINPETVMEGNKNKVVGYSGQSFIRTEASPEKLGTIIKAAFDAGADEMGDIALSPEKSELADAESSMAKEAVAKAMTEAEAIAQQLGVKSSGSIQIIMEPQPNLFQPRPAMMAMANRAMGSAAPMPIEAGSTKVEQQVRLIFGLMRKP